LDGDFCLEPQAHLPAAMGKYILAAVCVFALCLVELASANEVDAQTKG
jgi:hypothetical protein